MWTELNNQNNVKWEKKCEKNAFGKKNYEKMQFEKLKKKIYEKLKKKYFLSKISELLFFSQ